LFVNWWCGRWILKLWRSCFGWAGDKPSNAAWGHTLSGSRGLQVPETCNHSCTCYKEYKRKSVMFPRGQSLCQLTLMEGPRTWVEMGLLHQMTNSGWKPNNRLVMDIRQIGNAQSTQERYRLLLL
jgi:hypothetical protein